MRFCKEKLIFTSLSPNTEKDDIILALKLIFQFGKYKKGRALEALRSDFKRFLGAKHCFLFNSGRAGFLAILEGLDLKRGEEILLQAFTCNAAVNPIIWSRLRQGSGGQAGLKPVFVDINPETLNIDPVDLEKKISSKSRAVLIQHTFGLPADLDRIQEICQKHNLILIEDCAHSLGATHHGRKVGTFGQASFFSFGRDKVISSVYGGAVVTNDDNLAKKIKEFQANLKHPSYCWVFQQLLHPLLTNFFVKPLYGFFGLGRWFLILLQKTKILSKAVHKKEKKGKKPGYIPRKMPNVLAILALNQFKKLEKFVGHQREMAEFYRQELSEIFSLPIEKEGRVYMRYPLLLKGQDTNRLLKRARRQGMFLDDGWRKTVVVPPDTNQEKMGYIKNSCPKAERAAEQILNLPTHINISKREAKRIVNFLKSFEQVSKVRP